MIVEYANKKYFIDEPNDNYSQNFKLIYHQKPLHKLINRYNQYSCIKKILYDSIDRFIES